MTDDNEVVSNCSDKGEQEDERAVKVLNPLVGDFALSEIEEGHDYGKQHHTWKYENQYRQEIHAHSADLIIHHRVPLGQAAAVVQQLAGSAWHGDWGDGSG